MLHVVFLWHMHQPSYRDPVTGEVTLPWVRLHGVKDYSDMALALATPNARSTVNWVPGLLDQCEALARSDHSERERFWRLTLRTPASLGTSEVDFIRRHFFSLGGPMLEPWPRYRELRDIVRAGLPLTLDELRDLQVWFNLAWTGIAVRQEEPAVAALFARGRDFTEEDKQTLLEAQRRAVLALPARWRALADSGQVELSASPHYHPILPLLIDTDLARAADPSTPMPDSRMRMPDDAMAHMRRAIDSHTRRFGQRPRGMWPSEGSVAAPLLPLAHELGIEWLATDESILWKSLGGSQRPSALRPTDKFVPWMLDGVRLVFRDHGLSDKIGFVYASWPAERAYADFIHALTHIERSTHEGRDVGSPNGSASRDGASQDRMVLIALDGENCWEHYPGGVTRFLPGLLERIARTPGLRLSTVSEALAAVPARPLPGLAAGSWIDGTFRTWLGDPVKNRAWELLTAARHAVTAPLPKLLEAEPGLADLVMRAEASDWWWWFGEGHSSSFDMDFDALFRSHLMAIWLALGKPVPPELHRSVYELAKATTLERGQRPAQSKNKRPSAMVSVQIDGRRGWYFKWAGAGEVHQTFGSIHRAESLISRLRYGNDAGTLSLSLEGHRPLAATLKSLQVELTLSGPGPRTTFRLWPPGDTRVRAALGEVLDAAIPLGTLAPDAATSPETARLTLPARLYGVLSMSELEDGHERPIERFPGTGELELELLSPLDAALDTGV